MKSKILKSNYPHLHQEIIDGIVSQCKGNITLALGTASVFELQPSLNKDDLARLLPDEGLLNSDEKLLLKIMEESKVLPSNELFHLYRTQAKYPKSERSFRVYMKNLCELGLVKSEGDNRGRIYEFIKRQ